MTTHLALDIHTATWFLNCGRRPDRAQASLARASCLGVVFGTPPVVDREMDDHG